MTKPNTTEIIVVLDRSGSMQNVAADMRGGFDAFIAKQRQLPGDCRVTLAQFDDRYDLVYTAKPLSEVPPLVLEPRGSTALLDAVGRTINFTGARLLAMREEDRPSQVLFVIITDGHENASKEYRREHVADLTKQQREIYKLEFVYLGANQDAFAVAAGMGITRNAVTYEDKTKGGVLGAFSSASAGISNYRSAGNATMDNLLVQKDYDDAVVAANNVSLPTDSGK